MNTSQKERIACLKIELRAAEKGATISRPTTDCCRYDAVVDYEGRLYRAQIKWANGISGHASGSIQVNLRKISRGNKAARQYYTAEEIDVLLVYLPTIDKVLWIDALHFNRKQNLHIRIVPPKNNQIKGCLMAEKFIW
jgi:hypothetical protein